jgi:hypothetical protein
MTSLPAPVAALAAQLVRVPGAVAVVLGGSRATGAARPDSDWDLGLYYRASEHTLDPADVRALGHDGYVSALGEWGPIVHGGAWLTVGGLAVDVLFRDLDIVERRLADARRGAYEVLDQRGSIVGAPTYVLAGELAVAEQLHGEPLPRPEFPAALATTARERWSGRAAVSLLFAEEHERAGDALAATGMLVDATLSVAHARLAARRDWVLGEKRLIERAGLQHIASLLLAPDGDGGRTAAVAAALGISPLRAR